MRPSGKLKGARDFARGLPSAEAGIYQGPARSSRLRDKTASLRVRDPPLLRYCRVCTRERHAAHSSERAVPQPKRATSRDRLLVEEEHLPAAAALCCVRELRRELSARGSTSKPSAATSAFSASSCVHFEQQLDRTLVLRTPSSDGRALVSPPAHATVKPCSPRSRRSLVQRRRTAAARGERTNANPGRRICSRQAEAARTKLAAGSERGMESACADHDKCAGSKATAGGNCRPGCLETFHLRRE